MPVAADLVLYFSANHPDNDVDTASGIIQDENHATGAAIPDFTAMAANDTLRVVSDDASDVRDATVEARSAGGGVVSDTVTISGTTPVDFTSLGTVERILLFSVDEDVTAAGLAGGTILTCERVGGTDVALLVNDEVEVVRLFRKGSSSGSQVIRFETLYWVNLHATEDLNAALASISADPAEDANHNHEFAVHNVADADVGTLATRLTAPAGGILVGGAFVDDPTTIIPPGGALLATEKVAVFVRQTLEASATAQKDSLSLDLSGTSV